MHYSRYMWILLDSVQAGGILARQENNNFPMYQCLDSSKKTTLAWHISF